jgi:hypothetical protein
MTLCVLLSYKLMLAYFPLKEFSTQTLSKAFKACNRACMLSLGLFLVFVLYRWRHLLSGASLGTRL